MDVKAAFVTVLRCALWRTPMPTIEEELWQPLLNMAKEQHLSGLISEKLAEIPAFCSSSLFEQALRRNVQYSMQQSKWDAAFFRVYRAMEDAGVQLLVLKGAICRKTYGELGSFRPSGDEDLMVRMEDFDRAWLVLEALGYRTGRKLQNLVVSNVHHVPFQNREGHQIELHVHPIGITNGMLRKMDAYFDDAFDHAVSTALSGGSVYTLCPTEHYLFLIFHAAKHFCRSGLGIRMLMDAAMFYVSHRECIDIPFVQQALQACRLEGFCADMISLANEKLGFDLPQVGQTVCPEMLLDQMLHSSAFGEKNAAASLTSTVVFSAIRHESGLARAILSLVFPSRELVELLHPELRGNPLRLLMYYPKRWLKAAHMVLCSRGTSPVRSLQDSRKRLRLLRRYGIR